MSERPILFSAPMVRAILDGRKTQTRRLVTPQPIRRIDWSCKGTDGIEFKWGIYAETLIDHPQHPDFAKRCPYGAPGDRLWVRETWRYADWTEDGQPWIRYAADDARRLCERVSSEWAARVADIWAELSSAENVAVDGRAADRKWRPSIFLPRWASRITLAVTAVRVERLQAISEADAIAEGIAARCDHGCSSLCGCASCVGEGCQTAAAQYSALWDTINGDRAPWASNPWVWVVEFSRVEAGQ